MPRKYQIDIREFEEQQSYYQKYAEKESSLVTLLNKIDTDSGVLSTKESQLKDSVVDSLATYDAFLKAAHNQEMISGDNEESKLEFLNLYALYAACVKGSTSLEESFSDCGKAPIKDDAYIRRFEFKELFGDYAIKEQFQKHNFDSLILRGAKYVLQHYVSILETAMDNDVFGLDNIVGLTKGMYEKLCEITVEEMGRDKYKAFYNQITNLNIQIDGIVLEGLNYSGKSESSGNIPDVKFSEISGNKDLVSYLKEMGTRLLMYNTQEQKNPHSIIPPTMLVLGKPGGGKTMALQAFYNFLINNAVNPDDPNDKKEINYIAIDSSVKSKWLGESEELLTKKIETARDPSKISVVYIEDIDALFADRGNEQDSPAEARITQALMNLLEGVKTENNGNCIVIATTNRDYDLDDALKDRFRLLTYAPGPRTKKERLDLIEGFLKSGIGDYKINVPDSKDLEELTQFVSCDALDHKKMLSTVDKSRIDSYSLSGRDIRNVMDAVNFDATRVLEGNEKNLLPEEVRRSFFMEYDEAVEWAGSRFVDEVNVDDITDKHKEYVSLKILQGEQAKIAKIEREAEAMFVQLEASSKVAEKLSKKKRKNVN